MANRIFLLSLFAFSLIATACKKDFSDRKCEELKKSMSTNNITEVKNLVTDLISKLPSEDYNEENVNALVSSLSGDCGMNAQSLCFGCIQTFPEQSEIKVSFTYAGTAYVKIFDISYFNNSNKMRIVNMHD